MASFARISSVVLFSVAFAACAQSRPAKAQDTAQEHMQHMRFGRNEVAAQDVSDPYRQLFLERHKDWGNEIRIGDVDLTGMKINGDDAEVGVKISWYRAAEGDLHVTAIKQTWHDQKGNWRLMSEEKIDGSGGLWGEKQSGDASAAPASTNAKKKNAQFPTYVLGQQKEDAAAGD